HHLERRLAHPRLVHHPAELDAALAAEQALDRGACLARVDAVAEAAGGAEGEAEELELVRARPRALGKQLEAAGAHLRVVLVGEQLDAIVERAHRRQQVMAKTRAEQRSEFVRFHSFASPILILSGSAP